MAISGNLLQIKEFEGLGYKPVVDFEAWRVAFLNYIDELDPWNIKYFQKHDQSDESFVLLSGKCILYFTRDRVDGEVEAIDMEAGKVYNIKKGIYHTHTLSTDARVVIIENSDTRLRNSPRFVTSDRQKEAFTSFARQFWGKNYASHFKSKEKHFA